MHFQMRFPNGDKVPFETLNAEAANLWGIGIARDKVQYVFPNTPINELVKYDENNSWYEMIGSAVMHPQTVGAIPMQQTWSEVKETMFNSQIDAGEIWEMKAERIQNEIASTVAFLKPYFELIDLWYSKGYAPIRAK